MLARNFKISTRFYYILITPENHYVRSRVYVTCRKKKNQGRGERGNSKVSNSRLELLKPLGSTGLGQMANQCMLGRQEERHLRGITERELVIMGNKKEAAWMEKGKDKIIDEVGN